MATTPAQKLWHHPVKLLGIVQWLLPLTLFATATTYELLEHYVVEGALPPALLFASEVMFFGILGPLAVAIVLGYVRRLVRAQAQSQHQLEDINQRLEQTVAERTRHLEEARFDLQERNEALRMANLELRQLDQMKSDFVALVSHSFRAPLTTLNGALELIAQDSEALPGGVRDSLDILAQEVARLTGLVRTTLDLSRLDSGNLKLSPGPVAMGPLLHRVANTTHLPNTKARVSVEAPRGLPPAWADEVYVEEIARNLISNAEKYSPGDSPISVAAHLVDDRIAVSVTDHGPGIPQEQQARIFQAFHRLETGLRRDTSGLGLGLYFASKLVQAQEGRIWVESPIWPDATGAGARFVFTLPVAAEVPSAEESTE